MKIAFDASILGQGYINPKARTGIFRVVESLMFELIQRDDIELSLVTLNQDSSILDQVSTKLYIKNLYSELSHYFHSCYVSQLKSENIYQKLVILESRLIQNSTNKVALYKLARAIDKLGIAISKIESNLTQFSDFFDLYHSLYLPFSDNCFCDQAKRILTIYDLIPLYFQSWVTKNVYHRFLRTLESINLDQDFILCISEHTKNDFCEYTKMNPERVFVTYLAASSTFYSVTDTELITETLKKYKIPKTPYFLSLCTLEPRKNLSFLLRCFAELIKQEPTLDINLVLVGVSGWKNADIFEAITKDNILKDRVIFTGYVADEDLSAIYSGALAFIYPSLYEGFGLPPLEAMQCGTPVITSNTSSLPEVVGDAGIMIDPKQEDELCQALLTIINNNDLRGNLADKGLERAKQFTWKKCVDETVKVYQIAVNS